MKRTMESNVSTEKKVKQFEVDMVELLALLRNQDLTQGERVNKLSKFLAEKPDKWLKREEDLGRALLEAALNDDHECVYYLLQYQSDLINYRDSATYISILAIAFVLGSLFSPTFNSSIGSIQICDPIPS